MKNKLQNLFPMIKTREEVLAHIRSSVALEEIFNSWEYESQEKFLDICTGVRGMKILYDGIFKEVMNPEYAPERLEELISLLIDEKVKIVNVLPTDSVRLGDENALVVMDMVVELADGSIADVEIQKIGYMFPGERSACYSADMLLRQYKRVRGEKKKKFSYKDVKNVYTIVIFEKSPNEFFEFESEYIHKFEQKSDTGIKLELLQKYVFVALDIFKKNYNNNNIETKLDAWMRFFSTEEPEDLECLISNYPEFKIMYEEIYHLCENIEKVMNMFSKELRELDRNTTQYMIDVMQEKLDEQKAIIEEKDARITELEAIIASREFNK